MAIPTTRAKNNGRITISHEKCTGCGLCVSVCKDFGLSINNGKVTTSDTAVFGCIGCGHCMAICPTGAITIQGREISPDDLFTLPSVDETIQYENLIALLQRRRSVREFTTQPVDPSLIKKILNTAATAPMGIPPSDVHVMVLDTAQKVHQFTADFCRYLESMKWIVSGWFLTLMKPFWSKSNDELFRKFVRPLFSIYTEGMKKDENLVLYDAPLAMYFYGSPYADPADPLIAATYAMLAGESIGLGTCMLGAVHPLIQNGRKAAAFRKKYNIRHASREGLFVVFGYPAVKYSKGIKRTFAAVDFYQE